MLKTGFLQVANTFQERVKMAYTHTRMIHDHTSVPSAMDGTQPAHLFFAHLHHNAQNVHGMLLNSPLLAKLAP